MSPHELLDDILTWFVYAENAQPVANVNDVTVGFHERYGNKNVTYLGNLRIDISKVVERLAKDKHLNVEFRDYYTREKYYTVTLDGILFLNSGGYKAQLERESNKRRRKRLENNLIVYGTFAAGAYGIYEIIKDFVKLSNFAALNVVYLQLLGLMFLLGGLSVAILILLVKEILNKSKG